MNHGSLFSGIGGFDLAAEWMGWDNKFHCEWNEFGQRILKHYWPNAESYEDITKTDFTIWRGEIDILTGGFPCQPYSHAGKRKGKEDERHLWPKMLRAIREIKPRYIVGENVAGLVSWSGGLVFEEVQSEMEAEGYEVQPILLPACAVGAPHRRDRIWFVANSNGSKPTNGQGENGAEKREVRRNEEGNVFGELLSNGIASDSDNRSRSQDSIQARWEVFKMQDWSRFPTQSPICSGDDGLSERLDGITFPKWRNESIKGYGNAIVPQVAYEIFKAIESINENNNSNSSTW